MELITPGIGLLFWMLLCFSIVFYILAKFAWKPIMNSLNEREQSIDSALRGAQNARAEVESTQTKKEQLIAEARQERETMIREATTLKNQIIQEAREQAQKEAHQIIENARLAIENEKKNALREVKGHISEISLQVAEQILRKQLVSTNEQDQYIEELLKDIKAN
jgi:F-type H+-transporting ATPase subunit b